ncbi:MAG: lamin tail domain-containing protein, partial [Candidatus Gracilibacteria bacterium]
MQKIFRGFFILILVAAQIPQYAFGQSTTPAVSITEIGVFEPAEIEWVEIFNKSDASVDLTGWKFFEENTNHGLTAVTGDFIIDAGEYAIIASKADKFQAKYSNFTGTILDSSWGNLKEAGELIGLKDKDGNFVEQFTYPQILDAKPENNSSLERVDAGNWRFVLKNSLGLPAAAEIQNTLPATVVVQPILPAPVITAPVVPVPVKTSSPTPQQPTVSPKTNNPPQAIIQIQSGELVANKSTTINFDGRASSDPDGDKLTFSWDLGDGTSEISANPGLHKYDKPGNYTVTLIVSDQQGAQGKAQTQVQVIDAPATASSSKTNVSATANSNKKTKSSAVNFLPLLTQTLPENFQDSTIEVHGYLVFGNMEDVTTKTATTAKKSTKETFQNGDLSDAIRITELIPAPDASDENGEWIEIFNSGTETINLGNWQIFDAAKKASPYLIPDTLAIPQNSYVIFQKTETKISLNNGSDEIFLADFEGKVIDSVSYTNSKKAYSYALVQTAAQVDLQPTKLASSALAAAENSEWQWVDEPTPGQPNPIFQNISGTVLGFVAGGGPYENLLKLTMQNGETKEVNLSSDVLDPKIAETVLTPGSQVSLQAQKRESGNYEIKKIADVKPPEAEPKKETNYFVWIIFGVIAVGILLNMRPLIRAIKEWRAKKRATSATPTEENSL